MGDEKPYWWFRGWGPRGFWYDPRVLTAPDQCVDIENKTYVPVQGEIMMKRSDPVVTRMLCAFCERFYDLYESDLDEPGYAEMVSERHITFHADEVEHWALTRG